MRLLPPAVLCMTRRTRPPVDMPPGCCSADSSSSALPVLLLVVVILPSDLQARPVVIVVSAQACLPSLSFLQALALSALPLSQPDAAFAADRPAVFAVLLSRPPLAAAVTPPPTTPFAATHLFQRRARIQRPAGLPLASQHWRSCAAVALLLCNLNAVALFAILYFFVTLFCH